MSACSEKRAGFSLTEMLVTIAVIAIVSAVAVPALSEFNEASKRARNLANAKSLESISSALASLGVAHVIPESMGGVEATARLLKEGVTVPEGPMAGEFYQLPGLGDNDIKELPEFLEVQYDMRELRLVLTDDYLNTTESSIHDKFRYCRKMPCRIERVPHLAV